MLIASAQACAVVRILALDKSSTKVEFVYYCRWRWPSLGTFLFGYTARYKKEKATDQLARGIRDNILLHRQS